MAVVELIKEGQKKGVWDYRHEPVAEVIIPKAIVPLAEKPAPVISSEVKEEAKVEEKKDVVVQPQTQSEAKPEALPSASTKELEKLPSEVTLKEAEYIYKEPNEKSQKTWQFKKGTVVTVVGADGDWIEVRDVEKRKGFVKKDVLVNKQQ